MIGSLIGFIAYIVLSCFAKKQNLVQYLYDNKMLLAIGAGCMVLLNMFPTILAYIAAPAVLGVVTMYLSGSLGNKIIETAKNLWAYLFPPKA
jgi:ABC-type uncharacterized transport system permease subunit